jgi:hypothetical protein
MFILLRSTLRTFLTGVRSVRKRRSYVLKLNFKDKYLWQGGLLFLGCLSGVLFPGFLMYILILGMVVGVVGVGFSLVKQNVIKI